MKNRKGFTLIELMISISIIAIVSMASYAPYNHYKNKAKLKNTASKISQLLYEGRNKAINGSVGENGNVSIGLFFDSNTSNNNKIDMFSYPHNIDNIDISYLETIKIKKIKTLILEKGIQIDKVEGDDNLLFVFDSISGKVNYYKWNGTTRIPVIDDEIIINLSYEGSTASNLQKAISYFTLTNITDY